MSDVTRILSKIEAGDPQASAELLPLVYEELRKLAAARMANERADHTLQATALVHEAYVRLVDTEQVQSWDSRGHFFSAAAEAMRRILVDAAREKRAQKRGGERLRIDLDANLAETMTAGAHDLLELNDALEQLAKIDAEAAELVKLRMFAELSVTDAGRVLKISKRKAYENWDFARSWFTMQLSEQPG